MQVGEGWVDRSKDGATVSPGQDEISNCRNDADVGLRAHLLEGGIDGAAGVVDDLGVFHRLSRRDVEPRHISADVGIPDDGKKSANRHASGKSFSMGLDSSVRGPEIKSIC